MDSSVCHSSLDIAMEPARKRIRPNGYEEETTYPSVISSGFGDDEEDDKESVHSWQSAETAIVGDSGDDWDPAEDCEEESMTEYELMEEESSDDDCMSDSSSSSLSDVPVIPILPDCQESGEVPFLADLSGWESDERDEDDEESDVSQTIWHCLKCRASTVPPRRFCFSCNQRRMCGLPPRPNRTRKRRRKSPAGPWTGTTDGPTSSAESCCALTDNSSNICSICQSRPRDGAFVHGRRAHVLYCFPCTERISKKPGAKCPICRLTIQSSVKLFFS